MARLILEHPQTGIIKKATVGFSWTTLFFPTLPALFRWDIRGFIVQLLLNSVIWVTIFIFPFIYNKQYIMRLLRHGYQVHSIEGGTPEKVCRKLKINLPFIEKAPAE